MPFSVKLKPPKQQLVSGHGNSLLVIKLVSTFGRLEHLREVKISFGNLLREDGEMLVPKS